MKIPLLSPKIDSQKNMVIDVTYVCNYTCNYCRWGSSDTPGRFHQNVEDILVDPKELESIGVERIVLSGGEPLLHPHINQIVHHFSNFVEDIILITNGWLADLSRIQILIDHGLTGVAFSIDSVEPSILHASRDMTAKQIEQSLTNFKNISDARNRKEIGIELGVNSVVSSANCSMRSISNLLEWSVSQNLDYVNFNMVFDDGYTGKNAPELLLTKDHTNEILNIANFLHSQPPTIHTNSYKFWLTIAAMLNGSKLDGGSCGLRDRQTLLYRGKYHFCAWLENPTLGEVGATNLETVTKARADFQKASRECFTGPHCHCLQSTTHEWELIHDE
jgi:molybdenum cofactor biosynthesis enzyme MoaA